MNLTTYETALREHLAVCRRARPIPARATLSRLERSENFELGSYLQGWLRFQARELIQQRNELRTLVIPRGWDPTPIICLHTTNPGLLAAEEILGGSRAPVVWGLDEDFASFPMDDPRYDFHVEYHSSFEEVPSGHPDAAKLPKQPLSPSERYLFHHVEFVYGRLMAHGARHLWKWDGAELTLLEQNFQRWVS